MKKNRCWFIIFVIVIILLTILFYFLNNDFSDKQEVQEDSIIIKYDDSNCKISLKELKNINNTTFDTIIRSTSIKNKKVKYTGVELALLFKTLNLNIEQINKIIVISSDSYRITLSKEELTKKNNVFLVYKKNNRFIKDINDSIKGSFHLIIRQDYFSQRWVKGVNRIILQ